MNEREEKKKEIEVKRRGEESYGLVGLKRNMLLDGSALGGLLASSSSSFSDLTAASTSLVLPAAPQHLHDTSNTTQRTP